MATNEKNKAPRVTAASVATDVKRIEEKLDALIAILDHEFKTEFREGYHGTRRQLKTAGLVKEN
jgi:hypothetical protein